MEDRTDRASDERAQFAARDHDEPAAGKERPPAVLRRAPPEIPQNTKPRRRGFHAIIAGALESERDQNSAFLFVPVLIAGGVLLYFVLPFEPPVLPLILTAALLAAASLATSGRAGLRAALLAGLMVLSGMLAAKVETVRAGTQMLGSEITTRLSARVARIEHQASGRVRLTLDVIGTARPELRYAPERVRATARAVPEGLRPGEVVEGVVRLMPASGPVRPQSYDFAFKSYFDGIGAVGFFMNGPERSLAEHPPDASERFRARIEDWRARMADRISGEIGGAEGAIAAALITGIRAGIPEDINEALRITGLYHVISISGLHMALVGGIVMVSLRGFFALFPSLCARRPVKKYAAGVAIAATAFYLFISGADIAAQRSFIMLAVMLIAIIFDRAALTMRNLAISAVIILILAPHEVAGPSFQMSFAATAALVAAYAAWSAWRAERIGDRPPPRNGPVVGAMRVSVKYAAGMSMTSIVAGGATALFTAWHFQQVAPLGLVANLTAMPFVSVIVMPMAVLASLLMPLGLDGPPLQLMGLGIAAMNAIAVWLAERSAFDATGAIPLSAVLVLTAALAILTMSASALRWAAVPLLVAGTFMLASRELPDLFVSEDGRLVALRLEDGRVAVNRPRPRAFTMQNWQRAFDAREVVRPVRVEDEEAAYAFSGAGFACTGEGLCVARHDSGLVVHAPDAANAARSCAEAAVIVIDDATADDPCAGMVVVITSRELARRGSVEIMLGEAASRSWAGGLAAMANEADMTNADIRASTAGSPDRPRIRFAISEPFRPWHDHRRFSRAARGMPPWQPTRRTQADNSD